MTRLHRAARKVVRSLVPRGLGDRRWFTRYPDDVMLVSYPRSGSTWTRFLIANLMSRDHPSTFDDIEARAPGIDQLRDAQLRRLPRPRILKSHEYLDPRYGKVIYLLRDPRDVALSYYHFKIRMRAIDDSYSIMDFVAGFVEGRWDKYGSWRDHVGGWFGARRDDPDFCLIRYEDLLSDPAEMVRRMIPLLGLEVDEARIAKAVDSSRAASISKLHERHMASGAQRLDVRTDLPFIRLGVAGGGLRELPSEACALIEDEFSKPMKQLGYLGLS